MTSRRPRRGSWVEVVLALGAMTVAAACQAEPSEPRARSLPGRTTTVDVTLREYKIGHRPQVPSGRVMFAFRNTGRLPHRPSLVPLADDVPPIDQQLRGSERRAISPYAGIATLAPGERGVFAVDLEPGQRYAFICFAADEDGRPHAVKGMSAEFRAKPIEGKAGTGKAPQPAPVAPPSSPPGRTP